jgi:hypothetical protein
MSNSAHKKLTTLFLALCLLMTSAYAACMVCDNSPFASKFSLDGTCAQSGFEKSAEPDDCCQKNSCTEPEPDIRALSRRNTTTKTSLTATTVAAPSIPAPPNSYATLAGAGYAPSFQQDRRYLQYCSFRC